MTRKLDLPDVLKIIIDDSQKLERVFGDRIEQLKKNSDNKLKVLIKFWRKGLKEENVDDIFTPSICERNHQSQKSSNFENLIPDETLLSPKVRISSKILYKNATQFFTPEPSIHNSTAKKSIDFINTIIDVEEEVSKDIVNVNQVTADVEVPNSTKKNLENLGKEIVESGLVEEKSVSRVTRSSANTKPKLFPVNDLVIPVTSSGSLSSTEINSFNSNNHVTRSSTKMDTTNTAKSPLESENHNLFFSSMIMLNKTFSTPESEKKEYSRLLETDVAGASVLYDTGPRNSCHSQKSQDNSNETTGLPINDVTSNKHLLCKKTHEEQRKMELKQRIALKQAIVNKNLENLKHKKEEMMKAKKEKLEQTKLRRLQMMSQDLYKSKISGKENVQPPDRVVSSELQMNTNIHPVKALIKPIVITNKNFHPASKPAPLSVVSLNPPTQKTVSLKPKALVPNASFKPINTNVQSNKTENFTSMNISFLDSDLSDCEWDRKKYPAPDWSVNKAALKDCVTEQSNVKWWEFMRPCALLRFEESKVFEKYHFKPRERTSSAWYPNNYFIDQ